MKIVEITLIKKINHPILHYLKLNRINQQKLLLLTPFYIDLVSKIKQYIKIKEIQ